MASRHLRDALLPWMLPALVVAALELGARAGWIPTHVLPAPSALLLALWAAFRDGELVRDASVSTGHALTGLVIGGGAGFALGVVNATLPLAAKLTDLSLRMLRGVPHLAMIPLVLLWFDAAEGAILFIISVGVFFPLYLNTVIGVRGVDRGLIEMGRVYGLSSGEIFAQIVLPGALSSILAGLRSSLGIMWMTLIVVESASAYAGVGSLTLHASGTIHAAGSSPADTLLLRVLVYAFLGKLTDVVIQWLDRRALAWQPSLQPQAQAALA
jgi:sulfonate transport system permease protein